MTPRPLLVTAGGTRNPIDAIRSIAAGSTGTTGITVARALAGAYAPRLLGSAEACLRARLADPALPTREFGSTRDLMAKVEAELRERPRGVLVHSAAVGDYEVVDAATKLPSGQAELVLRLTPTPKIVDRVRDWDPDVFLVSFKAGSPDWDDAHLEAVARAQLVRTRSDVVFANRLGALDTSCMLLTDAGTTRFSARNEALAALVARLQG